MKINRRLFLMLNIPLFVGIGFLVKEIYTSQEIKPSVFGDKNIVLIQKDQQILSFGDRETDTAAALFSAIKPYFLKTNSIKIESLKPGRAYHSDSVRIDRLTENVTRVHTDSLTVFLFNEDVAEDEWSQIKAMPLKLESDFWILKKNIFPDFFPLPQEAILSINDYPPSKKLTTLASLHKKSLLTIKNTGGFALKKEANNQWNLKIKNVTEKGSDQ